MDGGGGGQVNLVKSQLLEEEKNYTSLNGTLLKSL